MSPHPQSIYSFIHLPLTVVWAMPSLRWQRGVRQFLLIRKKKSMSGVSLEDPKNKRKVEGRHCQLNIFRWHREHDSTLYPKGSIHCTWMNVSLKFSKELRESKVGNCSVTTNWGGGGVGKWRRETFLMHWETFLMHWESAKIREP